MFFAAGLQAAGMRERFAAFPVSSWFFLAFSRAAVPVIYRRKRGTVTNTALFTKMLFIGFFHVPARSAGVWCYRKKTIYRTP